MSQNPWGLYYSFANRITPLPLLHVHAAANIKELAAEVKLTQTYSNDTGSAREVGYSFPIPARAVVCSFVMIKQDGTRVVGLVQEKGEARETYDAAVSLGKQAALMEQQTPDVFQVAVGNIQPHETVRIELLYATVLAEDEENDSIRFHLPVHIGARYGQAPSSELAAQHSNTSDTFLEISVNVESVSPIAKIGCPSHTVSTELGPDPALPNAHELPFSNYARVSLSSTAALDKDFVLTVKSAGLDAPRCVAERHPTNLTTAVVFTLVPRFKLPEVARQEFIFLVDRSGFGLQIASFGNTCTMLWDEGSQPYNQATLDEATQYVDGMQANYGGTLVRDALVRCFAARKTDRPTSVFVLTDGAVWDVDDVLKEVKASVSAGTAQAYLRVSALGIGNSASTALCEGIARVGNGTCMMVGEQETTFTGKIARMLRAARTPMITGIAVDWGVPTVEHQNNDIADERDDEFVMVSEGEEKGKERAPLNRFDESVDPLQTERQSVVLSSPPSVQQSPFKIQSLSPGIRLNVYAILQGTAVPKVVTLTGFTEDGSKIELSVPVALSNLPNGKDSPPAIHALAARKIIQDIEDGQHAITASVPEDAALLARTVKAHIVCLAKLYSIMSSHTSFVAVDQSSRTPSDSQLAALQRWTSAQPMGSGNTDMSHTFHSRRSMARTAPMTSTTQSTLGGKRTRSKRGAPRDIVPLPTGPSAAFEIQLNLDLDAMEGIVDPQIFEVPVSHSVKSSPSDASPGADSIGAQASVGQNLAELTLLTTQLTAEAAPQSAPMSSKRVSQGSSPFAGVSPMERQVSRLTPMSPVAPPAVDILETLARHQSFDGCFAQRVLSSIPLNLAPGEVRVALGVSDEVFATIIAMAFLCTRLGPDVEPESWEAIYDKARAFVEDALRQVSGTQGVDELQARAVGYLV
ncbi:vault protein inter-alpha-trypsin domain-containing protein [Mycena sanguinolenta]|nr:vault protein inter-alpha-trypsin domain-containing protein [Mycena sanguinolenta]